MAQDLNKVQLIGRNCQDLELKNFDNGGSVVNVTIATNRKYKKSNSDEYTEESEYHKCTAYGEWAKILAKYLTKGKKVYVEGRLKTRKWTDANGVDRYTTEIIIENFIFLDSKWPSQWVGEQSQWTSEYSDNEDLPF